MLVSLDAVVPRAYADHYAVGAFNVYNLESASAVIEAAEDLRAPVILQTSEKALDYAGFDALSTLVLGMAKRSHVPVVVHLDHGRSKAIAEKCLGAGYTSVMIDCSHSSFDTNVRVTKDVVQAAKKSGSGVEAELGAVAGREDYITHQTIIKTEPEQASQFVQATGVHLLAVAIGNAHGLQTSSEQLDFALLTKIQEATHVPLVLHGASGNTKLQLSQALKCGVVKVNIDTDLRIAFVKALRTYLRSHTDEYDPREVLSAARAAVCEVVKQKIMMLGSEGRA